MFKIGSIELGTSSKSELDVSPYDLSSQYHVELPLNMS